MNKGYDAAEIARIKAEAAKIGRSFVWNTTQERDEDGAYFYFVGTDGDGKEVVYDSFLYTLRADYEMAVYDLAEQQLLEKFPKFSGIETASEDELDYLDVLVEEIESSDEVAVVERIELDEAAEYGVSLDVALNVDEVTEEVVEKFVAEFNADTLVLDDTEYSFSHASDDEDED
jgi:hypothetical protein